MIDSRWYQAIIAVQECATLVTAITRNAASNPAVEHTTGPLLGDITARAGDLRRAIDEVIARQMSISTTPKSKRP